MQKDTKLKHNTGTDLFLNRLHVSNSPNSCEISLFSLIFILWKNKFIIAGCTFFTTVLGIIYALLAAEFFSSNTIFILKTKGSSGGNINQLAAISGKNVTFNNNVDPSDYLDKILQDKDYISKLYEKKWFFKGDSLPLEQIYKIVPDTSIQNWEYVYFMKKIETIRKGKVLSIRKDPKTNILTLSSNAPDPQLSYALNLFTINYISNYIRNSIKTQAKEKRLFIEERIKEFREELTKAENALAKFKERNFASTAPKVALEEERLIRKVALNQEIFIHFQKLYELTKIEELDDQTLIQIVKNPEVPVMRNKPKRKLIVIIFMGTGFSISSLIAFSLNFIYQETRLRYRNNYSDDYNSV